MGACWVIVRNMDVCSVEVLKSIFFRRLEDEYCEERAGVESQ